jgi:nickel/cobalt transporter (NicO) family protein
MAMNRQLRRYRSLSLVSFLVSVLLWLAMATPGQAHWADMAAAEIVVGETETQMTLTFPTGLVAFADENQDGQLSPTEVQTERSALQNFLNSQIRLTDGTNQAGALTIAPVEPANLSPTIQVAPNTHSTLKLIYRWLQPIQGLKIHYGLFLPGVATAHCLATILHAQQIQTVVFTPTHQEVALLPGVGWQTTSGIVLALLGCFAWGAMHALSPGHGKTVVGAYLIGTRATPRHALFLGLTTTITHTIGVFALGLVTLSASKYISAEQLNPWLSVLSGGIVAAIGCNLLIKRLRTHQRAKLHHPHHSHHDHHHASIHNHAPELKELLSVDQAQAKTSLAIAANKPHHHHSHPAQPNTEQTTEQNHKPIVFTHTHHHHDHHHHDHHHTHTHHGHAHLPPDDAPITWRSLLALGISGGILPCPAALVVLLSAIALGNPSFGLLLVFVFSLGLAGVLTSLGLLLVYAKHLFQRVPAPSRLTKILPTFSALCITLLGIGITLQALVKI